MSAEPLDIFVAEWPIEAAGGTAGSAGLYCGRCFTHDYLCSNGEWGGEDDPSCSLTDLVARVTAHASECPKAPR